MSDPDAPFGPEVQHDSAKVGNTQFSVEVGRLYPLPVYIVVTTLGGKKTAKIFIGWKKAVAWANSEWGSA